MVGASVDLWITLDVGVTMTTETQIAYIGKLEPPALSVFT